MKVSENNYRYSVCPHCKSKKLAPAAVVRLEPNEYQRDDINHVNRTGYLCGNCQRYIPSYQIKYITDREEMRRDVKRLLKYLAA